MTKKSKIQKQRSVSFSAGEGKLFIVRTMDWAPADELYLYYNGFWDFKKWFLGSRDSFIVKSLTTRPRRLSELNINGLKHGEGGPQAVDRSHSEGSRPSNYFSEKENSVSSNSFGPRSLQAQQNRQNRANIALERINEMKLLSTQAKLTSNGKAPLIRKLFHKLCSTKLIPK